MTPPPDPIPPARPRPALRFTVLAVAALEFGLLLFFLLRSGALGEMLRQDWSRPYAWEELWLPGLFGVPSGLALLLAALDRGLGFAITLCILYALLAAFFLGVASVATIAG